MAVDLVVPDRALTNAARARRAPSMLHCTALICFVKVALRLLGFNRTLRWIHTHSQRQFPSDNNPPTLVALMVKAVAIAGALYPGRALCLEQSLVLYYLLRCAAVDAKLRLGVKPHPFQAHSWVEVQGQPVNDFPEHIRHFIALPAVDV